MSLLGLHNICCKRRMSKFFLAVEERVPVQFNVGVIYTLPTQGISYPLASHGSCHQWYYVVYTSSKLKHYHHQGHCNDIKMYLHIQTKKLDCFSIFCILK